MIRPTQPRPEKTGILLAAFGSSSPVGARTLSAFENKLRAVFPTLPVRWAFTSDIIRNRLEEQRIKSDSVAKAVSRMSHEKFTHIAIQPLHLIEGLEYAALCREAKATATRFDVAVSVGLPLLHSAEDVARTGKALIENLPEERTKEEYVLFMGHGTSHKGDAGYGSLADYMAGQDPRVRIGTMEGALSLDSVLEHLSGARAQRVWLLPLLSVVGTHARNDMAGDQPDSLLGRITALGMDCQPVLTGTAEYPGCIDIWIEHAAEALRDFQGDKALSP